MDLQVVGAGLGRTGTASLKAALEMLLGAPCYHMLEVFQRPDDVEVWNEAVAGQAPDWRTLFEGYKATVDWPSTPYWWELSELYPNSLVLLSTRKSAQEWWQSAERTIFAAVQGPIDPSHPKAAHFAMLRDMWDKTFCPNWTNAGQAMAAYERHNESVRSKVDPSRLLEWQPGQGWEAICKALDLPVPNQPFPHLNSTPDFLRMMGMKPG